jgi:hypothetical protein
MDVNDRENFQPSPKWLEDLHSGNPGQPWAWTEDQGWFDQWGVAKRVRDSRDQVRTLTVVVLIIFIFASPSIYSLASLAFFGKAFIFPQLYKSER